MQRVLFGCFAILVTCVPAWAQDQSGASSSAAAGSAGAANRVPLRAAVPVQNIALIGAMNYVSELRARKDPVRQEEAALATMKACRGLMQLVKDNNLFEALAKAAPAAGRVDGANETLRNHVDRFLSDFLVDEMDLLAQAGLSASSIDRIVNDGLELKSNFYIGKYDHVDAKIRKDLEVFTSEVCRAASAAKQITAKQPLDGLTRLGYGLGAAAVIAIDAPNVLDPLTAGIAVFSISWGLNTLSEAVRLKAP
jgi:hypothetical protein